MENSPFLMGKSTISMVIFNSYVNIFNSYVKLPEGMGPDREVVGTLAGRFFDDTYPDTSHIL
jgi:hypothetical protein